MTYKTIFIRLLIIIFAITHSIIHADDILITTCDFNTLHTAIQNADGVIQVDCEGIISFPRQISITGDVHLIGNEALILDGGGRTRLFYVADGASLTLENMTIQNGYSSEFGGAVLNDGGSLTIHKALFTRNEAGSGGAIYNFGAMTITDSHFMRNSGDYGGVIYNDESDASITNTYFAFNKGYHGVAVYNDRGNTTLSEVKLYYNDPNSSGSILFNTQSSLMDVRLSYLYSPALIYGSIINDNGIFLSQDTHYARVNCEVGVITDRGGNTGGCGFDSPAPSTDVVVTDCDHFWGRGTVLEAIIIVGVADGKITFDCSGTIEFLYELIGYHSVTIDGGGDIIFDGRGSKTLFRTIGYPYDETFRFEGLTFQNGKASRIAGAISSTGNLEIYKCTFENNQSFSEGGAIYHEGTIQIHDSIFTNNQAPINGGAIFAELNFAISTQVAFMMINSTFSNNLVGHGDGGAIALIPFYSSETNFAYIMESTFSNNSAQFDGGAIFTDDVNLTLTDSTFTGNVAGENGGAIYMRDAFITIQNSTFTNNTAGIDGGAIFHEHDIREYITVDSAIASANSTYTDNTCVSAVVITDSGGNRAQNADGCPNSPND